MKEEKELHSKVKKTIMGKKDVIKAYVSWVYGKDPVYDIKRKEFYILTPSNERIYLDLEDEWMIILAWLMCVYEENSIENGTERFFDVLGSITGKIITTSYPMIVVNYLYDKIGESFARADKIKGGGNEN